MLIRHCFAQLQSFIIKTLLQLIRRADLTDLLFNKLCFSLHRVKFTDCAARIFTVKGFHFNIII
jgi:hypothetical protein